MNYARQDSWPHGMRRMQRRIAVALLAAGLLAAVPIAALAEDGAAPAETDRAAQSRTVVQGFSMQLKGKLVEAIQIGGPEAAIGVCRIAAPAIAKEFSDAKGWSVGRTALKLRNPSNAPDSWERDVLLQFEEEIARGANPITLEHYETTTKDGKPVFRYMKAIPAQAPCLTCHGSNVSNSVRATLADAYPDDQATGFGLGDLRGAFTITQPLE